MFLLMINSRYLDLIEETPKSTVVHRNVLPDDYDYEDGELKSSTPLPAPSALNSHLHPFRPPPQSLGTAPAHVLSQAPLSAHSHPVPCLYPHFYPPFFHHYPTCQCQASSQFQIPHIVPHVPTPMYPPMYMIAPTSAMMMPPTPSSHSHIHLHESRPLRERITTHPSPYTSLKDRLSTAQTAIDPPSQAAPSSATQHLIRRRGKKRGAKQTRGGVRGTLFRKFGKPFWEILATITDQELADLSTAQQEYIAKKKAESQLEGGDDDSE